MARTKAGIAARIQPEEEKAIFTHCYGHVLNLSISDTIKRCKVMKDYLDACFELIKLMVTATCWHADLDKGGDW